MKKWTTWMIAGLIVAVMAGVVFAAGPGYGFGKKANCPAFGNPLNLSEEQQKKWNDLREKQWKETVSLRNELQTKRLELRALWTAPHPDREKILSKQKEINALWDQLQSKMTDARLEARKLLTPEQAAQLGAFGPGMGMGFGTGMWRQGPSRGFGPGGCPGWGGGPYGRMF